MVALLKGIISIFGGRYCGGSQEKNAHEYIKNELPWPLGSSIGCFSWDIL